MTDHETFEEGPVLLQCGLTLRETKLAYKTHGTLNCERSNAIVFPTRFSGRHGDNEYLIGPGKALDPATYFIVVPNLLGNGVSSSPSNTPPPMNKTELGPKKAAEMALELAWKGCKAVYLSFDIDSIDPGFAPGTGSPEPGGLLPREALEMVRLIAREGLCAMEVVEVSPPYDVNDNTAQLACRVMLDALGALVVAGKLGHRDRVQSPEP